MSGGTRAVLFDFGGTLYDYSTLSGADREALEAFGRETGIDAPVPELERTYREELKKSFRRFLHRPFYLHRDFFGEALVETARRFGREAGDAHVARHREAQWAAHRRDFVLRDGVAETLGEIRRRGLHLGIVSNIDEDQLLHLGEAAGLSRFFDSILSSERAGSCKPDTRIYEEALRRAGCGPEHALFVGDSIHQDILGANRAGIRAALLWHRPDRTPAGDGGRPDHVIRTIPEVLDLL